MLLTEIAPWCWIFWAVCWGRPLVETRTMERKIPRRKSLSSSRRPSWFAGAPRSEGFLARRSSLHLAGERRCQNDIQGTYTNSHLRSVYAKSGQADCERWLRVLSTFLLSPPLLLLPFLPALPSLVCIDRWDPVQVFPQVALMAQSGLKTPKIKEAHLATTADTNFHCQMVGRLLPQVALLGKEKRLFWEEGGNSPDSPSVFPSCHHPSACLWTPGCCPAKPQSTPNAWTWTMC